MNEKVETTYYIKTNEGLYLTNVPNSPEEASYHASRPREYKGLDTIKIDWDKHVVVVIKTFTDKTYKTVRVSDLEVIESD